MAPAACAPASLSACRSSGASGDRWPKAATVPVLLRAPRAEEGVVAVAASAGVPALSVAAAGSTHPPRWVNAALRSHAAAVPLVYEVWVTA